MFHNVKFMKVGIVRMLEDIYKGKARANLGRNQFSSSQNSAKPSIDTRKELAKTAKVSSQEETLSAHGRLTESIKLTSRPHGQNVDTKKETPLTIVRRVPRGLRSCRT